MIAVICWGFIIIFIIYFSFIAAWLLADPDTMTIIVAAVSIILIGILTTVLLILTMPI